MSVSMSMRRLLESLETQNLAENFYCIHCDKKFRTAVAASDANDQRCEKSPYKDKTHYTRPDELNLSQGQASAKIKAYNKKALATLAKMKDEGDSNYSKAKEAFERGYARDLDYLEKIGFIDHDEFNFITWYDRQVLAGDLLPESRRALAERTKFLPDGETEDYEGSMTKTQLKFIAQLATEMEEMLQDDDQIPGWVQNQISVAEENMTQAYSYMKPRA